MEKKTTSVFKSVLAVIVLWAAVLIGGTLIVYILNFFSLGRAANGSIQWYLLGIISGPVGVYLGLEGMEKLTPKSAFVFRGVNLVVVAVFCGCMLLMYYISNTITLYNSLQNIATCVAAGGLAYVEFAKLRK